MIIYFVRHGQTDDNLEGIIQGQLDTPLNDHGRRESGRLARRLAHVPFAEAWTSDLSRASETAEIVASPHEGLYVRRTSGLRERHLGSMQGRRRRRGEAAPNDAEPGADFAYRITYWFDYFLSRHVSSPPDQPILVVSHGAYLGTLLDVLLAWFVFRPGPAFDDRRRCHNTSIMEVACFCQRGRWRGTVRSWGDVGHLAGLVETDARLADDVNTAGNEDVMGRRRVGDRHVGDGGR